ncbi:MAG TPA: ABC transporter permease [Terriglobales bacterium]|nr:ABC transporter permease [Terriglobales bacterium]
MESLLQDVRYEVRRLRKAPAFAAIAVATLALGIGANTAIFSVVDATLFRRLQLNRPNAILRLEEYHQRSANLTGATFRDVREQNRVFSQVAAYRIFSQNLSDQRHEVPPEQIDTAFVSQDFLPLVGVTPFAGQGFTPEQFCENAEGAVILSYGLWQHRFGSDREIVGKSVTLHGTPHIVAGVMPMGFSFPEGAQAWAPLTEDLAFPENRRAHLFTTLARVKTGTSMDSVHAELQAISNWIQQENRGIDPGFVLGATRLRENLVAAVRPTLLILSGAVALVLLMACANLASLLLSRSAMRNQEVAVRAALGASRLRLGRQFLTETVLLGLLGGTAGCFLGLISVKALFAVYPGAMPRLASPAIDWQVLIFVVSVSLSASILGGSIPAFESTRPDLQVRLADSGRSTSSIHRRHFRSLLVIAELTIAMMLLAAAGLLIRSFLLLKQVDPGFDPSHLTVVRLTLPDSRYPELPERTRFVRSVLERLQVLPGVLSVAASGTLPFDSVPDTDVELEGHAYEAGNEPEAEILTATPGYFRTMGIRLLAGRGFTTEDIPGHPIALVINQTMAERFWPGESPLGKRVVMKDWGPPLPGQIVGVVSDVKQDSLETDTRPAIYYSFEQFRQSTLTTYLVVRAALNAPGLAPVIREQIWSLDRDQPVSVHAMDQIVSGSLERRRFVLTLLITFATLALLLAVIGTYGVIAQSVGQRRQEFGIRMALGAQPHQLLGMVLRQSVGALAAGLTLGLAGAFSATRVMGSLLFGIRPTDPMTFSSMAAILAVVALIASYIPARRAAQVDPLVVLRRE